MSNQDAFNKSMNVTSSDFNVDNYNIDAFDSNLEF